MIDIRVLNAGIAAALTALIGLYPYLRQRNELTRLFAFSNISLAIWNLGDLVVLIPESHSTKLLLFRLNYVAGIFSVWCFFRFIFAFIEFPPERLTKIWRILKWSGIVLVALSVTPLMVANIDDTVRPFKEFPGPLYPAFIIFLLGGFGIPLWRLFASFKNSDGMRRNKLKYMFAAQFFILMEACFFFATLYVKDIPPYYFYLQVIYVLILAYAVAVHRVLDIDLLARDAVIEMFAFILMMVPFGMGYMLGQSTESLGGIGLWETTGALIAATLNFAVAVSLLPLAKNPKVLWVSVFLGLLTLWNSATLLLVIQPHVYSVYLYRAAYGVGCLVLLAWFEIWRAYLEDEKPFAYKPYEVLRWAACVMIVLCAATPLVLKELSFDPSGKTPAIEVAGAAQPLFAAWFLIGMAVMAYWTWRAHLAYQKRTGQSLAKWVICGYGAAATAASTYFAYVARLETFPIYPYAEIAMSLCLVQALRARLGENNSISVGTLIWALVVPMLAGLMHSKEGSYLPLLGTALFGWVIYELRPRIHKPVQYWVDRIIFPHQAYLTESEEVANAPRRLESLEDELPIVAQENMVVPYKSFSILIIFEDMTGRPIIQKTLMRTVNGEIVPAARWPDRMALDMLHAVQEKDGVLFREDGLPESLRTLDPWLFEVAVPLKANDKIVGMIVVGPKIGKAYTPHQKDIANLNRLAENVGKALSFNIKLHRFQYGVWHLAHDQANVLRILNFKMQTDEPFDATDRNHLKMIAKQTGELRDACGAAIKPKGKRDANPLEPVEIEAFVGEIRRLMEVEASKKRLILNLQVAPSMPKVLMNRVLAYRCVLNLMSNAIKYTESGHVDLAVDKNAENLIISVADTGLGISPNDQKRIFEPGYRVSGKAAAMAEGTGAGLSGVRDSMLIMGGRIEVQSELGKGSRFVLHFPLRVAASDQSKAA